MVLSLATIWPIFVHLKSVKEGAKQELGFDDWFLLLL